MAKTNDQMIADIKQVNGLQKTNEADYGDYVKRWYVDRQCNRWVEIQAKDGSKHTLQQE